jgi:hypothetical protein
LTAANNKLLLLSRWIMSRSEIKQRVVRAGAVLGKARYASAIKDYFSIHYS